MSTSKKILKHKKVKKKKIRVYIDKHVSWPSYPVCEEAPLGCIVRQGSKNVEWYGHKD